MKLTNISHIFSLVVLKRKAKALKKEKDAFKEAMEANIKGKLITYCCEYRLACYNECI